MQKGRPFQLRLHQIISILVFIHIKQCASKDEKRIVIAAIFESPNDNSMLKEQQAVESARDYIAGNERLIPTYKVSVVTKSTSYIDPRVVANKLCDLFTTDDGVLAIVSSTSCATSLALQVISSNLHIPHIIVPRTYCPQVGSGINDFSLTIEPSIQSVSKVMHDIANNQGWDGMDIVIFYDDTLGCERGRAFREAFDDYPNSTFHKFDLNLHDRSRNNNLYQTLKALKDRKYKFLLVASPNVTRVIFNAAIELELISSDYIWLIASQDLDPADLSINTTQSTVVTLSPRRNLQLYSNGNWNSALEQAKNVDLQTAIVLLSVAIHETSPLIKPFPNKQSVFCDKNKWKYWKSGELLMQTVRKRRHEATLYNALTSKDNVSYSEQLIFEIKRFNRTKFDWMRIGEWDSKRDTDRLNLTKLAFATESGYANKVLRIVSVTETPFMQYDKETDQYSGFCKALIDKLAAKLNFKYTIYDVDSYGKYDHITKKWTGVIGEVVARNADMGVSGMTIIAKREEVVDFTVRYMDYGVSIIMPKPRPNKSDYLGFLGPLSYGVWGCIAFAVLFEGLVLLIITRVSPYTKYTSTDVADCDRSRFKVKNSFWFTMSSVLQQGPEDQPRTVSGRVLAMFWYFFTLIMIATYTANLAAFLTVNRLDTPIRNLNDLVSQADTAYGTVVNSSVQSAFSEQGQSNDLYEKMRIYFENHPEVLVENSKEGYSKVKRRENYAFLWDEPIHKFEVNQDPNCDLWTVGTPFLLKGYGIALQKGKGNREEVNKVILDLQESGELEKMRKQYFEVSTAKCKQDDVSTGSSSAKGIEIDRLAGVFYVLLLGSALALFTACVELMWHKFKRTGKNPLYGGLCQCFLWKPPLQPNPNHEDFERCGTNGTKSLSNNYWSPGININLSNEDGNHSVYSQHPTSPSINNMPCRPDSGQAQPGYFQQYGPPRSTVLYPPRLTNCLKSSQDAINSCEATV